MTDSTIVVSVKLPRFERLVYCPSNADVEWLIKHVEKRFKDENGYPMEIKEFIYPQNKITLLPSDPLQYVCQQMRPSNDFLEGHVKPKQVEIDVAYFGDATLSLPADGGVGCEKKSIATECALDESVEQFFNTLIAKHTTSEWVVKQLSWDDDTKKTQKKDDAAAAAAAAAETNKEHHSWSVFQVIDICAKRGTRMILKMSPTPPHLRITSCFEIEDVEVTEKDGSKHTERFLNITDAEMIRAMRDSFEDSPAVYTVKPRFHALTLLRQRTTMLASGSKKLLDLASYLEKENDALIAPIVTALAVKKIAFNALWYQFGKGKRLVAVSHNEGQKAHFVAFDVSSTKYESSMEGTSFIVSGNVIESNGTSIYERMQRFVIREYEGMQHLDALPIQELTDERAAVLTARGKRFKEFALGCRHMQYTGHMLATVDYQTTLFYATGRIMVDTATYQKHASQPAFQKHVNPLHFIRDSDLVRCSPTLGAWSFALKRWGQVFIDNLSSVVYDSEAFGRLVLDEDHKSVISALVQNFDQVPFQDIVAEKGSGIVFLFHGKPGIGKTVTAEAIAELCKKPLYVVSAGELGTDAAAVDQSLERLIALTSHWKALVLIDEADVLMSERDDRDMLRNAVVSVFLRRIEYQKTIMFLTTNRVDSFDPAFASRISVAIGYKPFDGATRMAVWENLLRAAGIDVRSLIMPPPPPPSQTAIGFVEEEDDEEDERNKGNKKKQRKQTFADVVALDMNGREIRNVIRVAQTMATKDKVALNVTHLAAAAAVATCFALAKK